MGFLAFRRDALGSVPGMDMELAIRRFPGRSGSAAVLVATCFRRCALPFPGDRFRGPGCVRAWEKAAWLLRPPAVNRC